LKNLELEKLEEFEKFENFENQKKFIMKKILLTEYYYMNFENMKNLNMF
jgi:hypothetical protein